MTTERIEGFFYIKKHLYVESVDQSTQCHIDKYAGLPVTVDETLTRLRYSEDKFKDHLSILLPTNIKHDQIKLKLKW